MTQPRVWRGHGLAWSLAFLLSALVVLLTYVAYMNAEDRYRATAVVDVVPRSDEASSQLLQFQIPSLEALAVSDVFEDRIRQTLSAPMAGADWTVATEVTLGSGVISISVESETESVVVPVVNAYAARLVATDRAGLQVELISAATEAEVIATRPIIVVSGIGLAIIIPLTTLVFLAIRRRGPGPSLAEDQ